MAVTSTTSTVRGNAQAWVDEATRVLGESGLAAIKVESLARTLGVTKGSFYWHFKDRSALVAAVVDRWETDHTEAIIRNATRGRTPQERLWLLVDDVAARHGAGAGERQLYLEAGSEGVGPVVDRVIQRRIDYLADLLRQLGLSAEEAGRRAALALAVAAGMRQIFSGAPRAMRAAAADAGALAGSLLSMLLAPESPAAE